MFRIALLIIILSHPEWEPALSSSPVTKNEVLLFLSKAKLSPYQGLCICSYNLFLLRYHILPLQWIIPINTKHAVYLHFITIQNRTSSNSTCPQLLLIFLLPFLHPQISSLFNSLTLFGLPTSPLYQNGSCQEYQYLPCYQTEWSLFCCHLTSQQ